jgi:hypothetical protein
VGVFLTVRHFGDGGGRNQMGMGEVGWKVERLREREREMEKKNGTI